MRKLISLVLLMMVIVVGCKKDEPVIPEYIVTFDTQGGSNIDALKVVEGQKVTKPQDPTKENYIFSGWYKETTYTTVWDFEKETVMSNVTLYAKWIEVAQACTVTFDSQGGSEVAPLTVNKGEKLVAPAAPTKTGFEFDGWYTDAERLTAYDFDSPVTADITLYAKWTQAAFALVDFEAGADFDANCIIWDEETHTLDITNATTRSVLKFNVRGAAAVKTNLVPFFNKNASSIDGENPLSDILEAGSSTGSKIALKINTPVQRFKVPLDISVTIQSADNENDSETITIKSRPDYNGTGIQPVMMKTTDGNTVFWAPLNVGAVRMPESVPTTADVDITETCGKLFQWGRKSGVRATNKQEILDEENYKEKVFPTGEGYLSSMPKWDDKFILTSTSEPNLQMNWLRFAEGQDNPTATNMEEDAWYQKLWNSGTEEDPVKTESDPCPDGWRVPTFTEWQAIGAGVSSITKEWDSEKKLMSIPGADTEGEQKLVLPAAGRRFDTSGASNTQGFRGYYWSSSPRSSTVHARYVSFNNASLSPNSYPRAYGYSVRCIQE